jgi:exosortase/archaeosortase family protein
MLTILPNRTFNNFFVKFFFSFCILYFGTKIIIGLTVPSGYYSSFVVNYFNYPAALRHSIFKGTSLLVSLFGFETISKDLYHISFLQGRGIHLVYSCLGYGLLSCWIAFVFANNGKVLFKLKWVLAGCFVIWLLNVFRIAFLLFALKFRWPVIFAIDQHLIFNIIVYLVIIWMMSLFHRTVIFFPINR